MAAVSGSEWALPLERRLVALLVQMLAMTLGRLLAAVSGSEWALPLVRMLAALLVQLMAYL